MPALWIETPHARLRLESEHLLLTLPGSSAAEPAAEHHLPLEEIERVILSEQASITVPALGELMRRGVPVMLQDAAGRALGTFTPPTPAHAAARRLQYRRMEDPVFCLAAARALIAAKIAGQRRLLQRLQASRPAADAAGALARMECLASEAAAAPDSAALLGIEGMASQHYFGAWSQFLPPEFPMTGRTTRPPRCPVNAVLSYASAVVYGEMLAACHRRGLDPGPGCLHATQDRRWALPLDLMEPFRPALADALTLRLFAHRILGPADFHLEEGGVRLGLGGRQRLLRDFEKRLRRSFLSSRTGQRTTLRQEMDATVLAFRASLEQDVPFSPYRLQ